MARSTKVLTINEKLDFSFSWASWLAEGETILTDGADAPVITVPDGLTQVGDASVNEGVVTIWLLCETSNEILDVSCKIKTSAGREPIETITVYCLPFGFCTIAQVENFLNLAISDDADNLASCLQAIAWATEDIKNYCHQSLTLVEDDEITLDFEGGNMIFLPELPVISVDSVVEDDETLTETDDYILGQYGVLYRVGQDWASGIQITTVTYTHGHETIPQDIVEIAVRAASRIYQAGLRAKEHAGVTGVQSLSLGDYSVSYGSEHGGGVGEGVMGASAARGLLLSEKDTLDRYRYVKL